MASPLINRLVKKIEQETGVKCYPDTFQRTYAGHWMLQNGAWAWYMKKEGFGSIGSQWPASELVKSKYVLEATKENFGTDIDITPEDKK